MASAAITITVTTPACEPELLDGVDRELLDAVVLVQRAPHELATNVDALLLGSDDAVERLEEPHDALAHAEAGVGDAFGDLREIARREGGTIDDVLADEFDRGVAHGGRAVEHAMFDAGTDLGAVEELRVLRDEHADAAQGLGAQRDGRRLGALDDEREDRVVQAGKGSAPRKLDGEIVDHGLLGFG
ncbi:BQ5605_C052g12587 [Microbotryum silenes-dioicae]|uniref:BQ5605_C052g12587 protein n=1 Tax=Microbotryum silenes-dioicae TaxID=796604 RepID=A0A2X0MP86_9BASI|nr:BQ5605_C052g12587 [Microbotryum silenes-dioicae]